MKRNLAVAVLTGAMVSLSMWGAGTSAAENRNSASGGFETRVALLDLAHVFKSYQKFINLSEQLKVDIRAREKKIVDAQAEAKALIKKRDAHNPDAPTHKDLDQEVAKKKVELEQLAEGSRREFTQREANIYHQTYQEVEEAVKVYAQKHGITLVLRATRDQESSSANPQEVVKEVSQQVIFSLPQMDITEDIITMLNRANGGSAGAPPATNNTPAKSSGQSPQKIATPPGKNTKR